MKEHEAKKRDRKREGRSPWGLINQVCIEQEGPGESCVGRQVSIELWGRGYSQTYQSFVHKKRGKRDKTGSNRPGTRPFSCFYTSLP